MIVALFAKADHPYWGYPNGSAHGYSVVAVKDIRNIDELDAVQRWMLSNRFRIPDQHRADQPNNEWYGGLFDYIGAVCGRGLSVMNNAESLTSVWNSYGDNRFFGIYTAEDVLGEAYHPDGQYSGNML